MKKKIIACLIMVMCIVVSGCIKHESKKTITVFAAASMTETLEEIKTEYEEKNPNVEIVFNFDSSGTLKTQIEEGAVCDLFISAAQKQMDALEAEDLIDTETRSDLLENEVSLVVSDSNKVEITSFEDVMNKLKNGEVLISIGNEDVPVGQYTKKIFEYYQVNEQTIANNGSISYGSNVKEVTMQVAEEAVDCGIVYSTDAYSANLKVADTASEEMCGKVVYPCAVLKESTLKEETLKFLEYLKSEKAMKIFEKVGFKNAIK